LPAIHGGGDLSGNSIGGRAQRVVAKMRVPLRRGGVPVAEQLADYEQAVASGRSHAGEGMPQIMQANVRQFGAIAKPVPDFLQSPLQPRPAKITRC